MKKLVLVLTLGLAVANVNYVSAVNEVEQKKEERSSSFVRDVASEVGKTLKRNACYLFVSALAAGVIAGKMFPLNNNVELPPHVEKDKKEYFEYLKCLGTAFVDCISECYKDSDGFVYGCNGKSSINRQCFKACKKGARTNGGEILTITRD